MIMSLEFNTNTGTNKDCSVPQQSEHLIATTPFFKGMLFRCTKILWVPETHRSEDEKKAT